MKITAVLFVLLGLVACSKTDSKKPRAEAVPQFAEFLQVDGSALTTSPDCDLRCAELRREFRYVVYVGREVYCYWNEKKADTGTDFDALATRFEKQIITETSETEYVNLLRTWAASFHDGHVNVMAKDYSGIELFSSTARLEVLAPGTERETVVVISGGGALKNGDIVTAINGKPVSQALNEAETYTSGSTKRMRRRSAAGRFIDVMGAKAGAEDLSFTGLSADGKVVNERYPRNVSLDLKPDPNAKAVEATGADLVKAQVLPGGIGYLRIDGFVGTQMENLLNSAMDRLQKTRGLIIDVRKNGGGDLSGNVVIARLLGANGLRMKRSERFSGFVLSARPETFLFEPDGDTGFVKWHDLDVKKTDAAKHYAGQVVTLISSYCFSACDTFAAALKDQKLSKFVGEATGGGTGTPLVFDLPVSGHQFRYSTIRGLTPNGNVIEGNGTSPDVVAEPTPEDRRTGSDSQLKAALQLFNSDENEMRAAADSVTRSFGLIWEQRTDVAPTIVEDSWLKRISTIDEL